MFISPLKSTSRRVSQPDGVAAIANAALILIHRSGSRCCRCFAGKRILKV